MSGPRARQCPWESGGLSDRRLLYDSGRGLCPGRSTGSLTTTNVVNRVTSTASAAETHLFCTLEAQWAPIWAIPLADDRPTTGPAFAPHRPRGSPAVWTFPQDGAAHGGRSSPLGPQPSFG